MYTEAAAFAKNVVGVVNDAVSPWHSVMACKKVLTEAGFTEISEADEWNLSAGDKCFFTRNSTTLAAFIVGKGCANGPPQSFKVIGCHTDSPCLRMAPVSASQACGFE